MIDYEKGRATVHSSSAWQKWKGLKPVWRMVGGAVGAFVVIAGLMAVLN